MTSDKSSQLPALKQKLFYGYVIVFITFLIVTIQTGSRNAFGVFLKPMLADLEMTRGLISGAFSLSLLITGSVGILIGRLLDKLGPRRIMTICGLFMGIGYLLMSLVTTTWQLYLVYGVIIGIGSTLFVPSMSTVTRWFTTKRNIMTAIVGTGTSVGTLIAPLLADWIIFTYDWRISFAAVGITILFGVVVSAQFLRPFPHRSEDISATANTGNTPDHQSGGNTSITLQKAVLTRQFWLLAIIFL